jgi:hypothetical protein
VFARPAHDQFIESHASASSAELSSVAFVRQIAPGGGGGCEQKFVYYSGIGANQQNRKR